MGYVRPNPLRGLAGVLLIACHSDANAPSRKSERGGEAVYVMDVTGSDPVWVTEMGSRHPAWSPDGTSLSYSATVRPWYGYVCYAGPAWRP